MCTKLWSENLKGNRPLVRHESRRENNINTDLKKAIRIVDWIKLAQGRVKWRALVNTVMNIRVL
jgi:hypothetical protein